jgi:inhibitor of KinA sporulation pathway (predicted exonuclease)
MSPTEQSGNEPRKYSGPAERFVLVDLEATCWEGDRPAPQEIIEIGAVCYGVGTGPIAEHQTFVRPQLMPTLSDFCKELTQIRQEDVDSAPSFPEALEALVYWAKPFKPFTLAAWGNYDRNRLQQDCRRHRVPYPFGRYLNIKVAFANIKRCRPCGMARALQLARLPLIGTHHRGIDDVRKIARLLGHLLDEVGAEGVIDASRERD